jgi:hypothetical protein
MKRALLSLAAVLAALTTTAAAAPQDQWTQQVRSMLQEAGRRFEEAGYEMTHRIYTGSLNDDESTTVELHLDVGKEYRILGACDADCSDLDFTLFDGAGREIDRDLELDDFPLVDVEVSRSGTFRLRVAMAACSVEPCRFGIGTFGR